MKKLIGVLAIASVFSFVLMGCTPTAEGDTAPAPETGRADNAKADTPKTETPAAPATTS